MTQLRIYCGSDSESTVTLRASKNKRETVTVPLGDVFPALMDALLSHRQWPQDFANDEITIPADLFEVILAYQHYRQPSA